MIACSASLALPAAGNAAITLGPPDISVSFNVGLACSGLGQTGTCSNTALSGGALAQSPIDGVVVRWRAMSFPAPGFTPTFRIVRSAPGGFTGAGSSGPVAAYSGAGEFPAQLPIKKDDYIGIDLPEKIGTCAPCVAGVNGGGSDAEWRPALIDNEVFGRSPDAGGSNVMLLNADVEPDIDGDGFGDETQDKCAGSSGTQDGCPPPPPPKPVAPNASLSGSTSQDVLGQGAVIVFVTSAEPGSANATGTILVPGASKTYKLSPASSSLGAGARTRLKLKLSKKTKKAVRRALKNGRRPKASIDVTVRSAAGGATAIKRTVKVKRKKR
jgi:hypothetical protein